MRGGAVADIEPDLLGAEAVGGVDEVGQSPLQPRRLAQPVAYLVHRLATCLVDCGHADWGKLRSLIVRLKQSGDEVIDVEGNGSSNLRLGRSIPAPRDTNELMPSAQRYWRASSPRGTALLGRQPGLSSGIDRGIGRALHQKSPWAIAPYPLGGGNTGESYDVSKVRIERSKQKRMEK